MNTTAITSRVTSFAPQFLVDDLERSISYYKKLGFIFGEPWDGFYAIGQLDGLELHLKEAPKNPRSVDTGVTMRAGCVSSARPDLWRGWSVMIIPTPTESEYENLSANGAEYYSQGQALSGAKCVAPGLGIEKSEH